MKSIISSITVLVVHSYLQSCCICNATIVYNVHTISVTNYYYTLGDVEGKIFKLFDVPECRLWRDSSTLGYMNRRVVDANLKSGEVIRSSFMIMSG